MIDEHSIRERAYGIWEREGRPANRAETHWVLAAAQLTAEAGPVAKPTRKTAAAENISAPSVNAAAKPARRPRKPAPQA
jgi:hypothetical protein